MQVFLSVQWFLNSRQQLFLDLVAEELRKMSIQPTQLSKSLVDDPLYEISQTIKNCDGLIAVAFERIHCNSGSEYPTGNNRVIFNDRRSSTVWNHIEIAMAYQAGLPILVLQEQHLYQYGLIDKRIVNLSNVTFSMEEVINALPYTIQTSIKEWAEFSTKSSNDDK